MTEHEAATGEALSEAVRRAAKALIEDNPAGALKALDNPKVARALRDWDRLCGREVPSEIELHEEQDSLTKQLRQSLEE